MRMGSSPLIVQVNSKSFCAIFCEVPIIGQFPNPMGDGGDWDERMGPFTSFILKVTQGYCTDRQIGILK